MDELRELAKSTFKEWNEFQAHGSRARRPSAQQTPIAPLKVIKIATFSDQDCYHSSETTAEDTLLQKVDTEPQAAGGASSTRDASLTLVVIPRLHDEKIQVSKKTFMKLFDRFDIDPLVLQQIWLSGYGFHYYDQSYNDASSFYIGTYVYSLVWSFNPATLRTCAILLLRATPRLLHGNHALKTFEPVLTSYQKQIHTPTFFCFAVYVHFYRLYEEGVYHEVGNLRRIETTTGHGPNRLNERSQPPPDIDKLTEAAQEVADTQVHLSNLLRHGKYMTEIGSFLGDGELCDKWHRLIPSALAEKSKIDFEKLKTLLPMLTRQIKGAEPSVRYLQDRALGQSSVISGLLSHEDAQTNIKLANSSCQMAEAATKDSSAMKSIAIMTMLFLPGTFFAALFAVPSMPDFGRESFWLYWVLALPSTIFVFGFWAVNHNVWKPKQMVNKKLLKTSRSWLSIAETKRSDSSAGV